MALFQLVAVMTDTHAFPENICVSSDGLVLAYGSRHRGSTGANEGKGEVMGPGIYLPL